MQRVLLCLSYCEAGVHNIHIPGLSWYLLKLHEGQKNFVQEPTLRWDFSHCYRYSCTCRYRLILKWPISCTAAFSRGYADSALSKWSCVEKTSTSALNHNSLIFLHQFTSVAAFMHTSDGTTRIASLLRGISWTCLGSSQHERSGLHNLCILEASQGCLPLSG